jgi:hypothetical protein
MAYGDCFYSVLKKVIPESAENVHKLNKKSTSSIKLRERATTKHNDNME